MVSDHGAAAVGDGMDMEAHEATYHQFIELTKTSTIVVLNIVLLLLLWGIEGHGLVALLGLILTFAAAAVGDAEWPGLEARGARFRTDRTCLHRSLMRPVPRVVDARRVEKAAN